MMVVITLSNCPPKLRGDLTKWLIEIDTGVFVGNLNARVRDAVWNRICENIKNGRASMAFATNCEQKLDFRIHNTEWEPVDFDGIKLVRRNIPSADDRKYKETSKAMTNHINRLSQIKKKSSDNYERYVVVDIETTGLNDEDQIIEIGALLVVNGELNDKFSVLIQCDNPIPDEISSLTGITSNDLDKNGFSQKNALKQFLEFCRDDILVGHNIDFDMRFLQIACKNNGFPIIKNRIVDTMTLARKKIRYASRYSLSAIATHFGIEHEVKHRAIDDCILTYRIFEKLNEI
ncbi:MAG: type I-E CRISPR-associated endoribonuclease Cas2e [Oscillospiraceae bacterium]|nr:type I-E CRISPR-associated endoribonuclease Cas2e [Oscillospiraceae bacterium]